MSYHHFTTEERENLLVALTKNLSVREIARQLHRSPSSVSREIKRNTQNGKYRPSQSSRLYKKRRKNCRRKKLLDNPQLSQIVQELLQVEQWSPEQISNILRITEIAQISFTTIYRAIHGGIMEKVKRKKKKRERYPLEKFLRHKGRPYKKGKENRGRIRISHPIEELPEESRNRSELGHWEIDCIEGKKGGSCLVVMVERKSRFTLIEKAVKHSSTDVTPVIEKMLAKIPKEYLKTIISDRGKEFTYHSKITSIFQVEFYFAHPSSPWEKPTVENTNGLIRQYFPKRTSFDDVTEERIRAVSDKLNSRPRKVLDWLSPERVFNCCI